MITSLYTSQRDSIYFILTEITNGSLSDLEGSEYTLCISLNIEPMECMYFSCNNIAVTANPITMKCM